MQKDEVFSSEQNERQWHRAKVRTRGGGARASRQKRQKRQAHSKSFAIFERLQRDVTQTKAPLRSVCTILLVTAGVIAGLGAESGKQVRDATKQVAPASFNGSKAGDQREVV